MNVRTKLANFLPLRSFFLLLALLCLSAPAVAQSEAPEASASVSKSGLVYIIPIRNMIEPALLYVVRRGVAEAQRNHADAIVFVMDTPGGTLDAAGKILRIIQDVDVPTYTFVEKDAYSAGAIIALATDEIYMAPGSVIGDAMPIMMTPFGSPQEMPEALQEKMVSGVAAKIRAAAEQGGHDKELAESMVRRELEYTIDGEVICKEGELLTLTNEEAQRLVGTPPDQRPLLSAGTFDTVEDLLASKGLSKASVTELEVTRAERIARFISGLSPIFLILGILGVYIEIKTPGFGLPGLLGGLCLLLFFWGHHIAGLAGMEDVLLFLAGITLLLIELLVIPGFGFTGMAGILLIFFSFLSAMVEHYPGTPWYRPDLQDVSTAIITFSFSLTATLLAAWGLARWLPHTSVFQRLILDKSATNQSGFSSAPPQDSLLGTTGTTLCELRPAGTARILGARRDVVTRGDFIPAGTTITVVEVHGSRLVVENTPATT